MCDLSTEFCENRLSSFCVVLLTNKLTDADENSLLGRGKLTRRSAAVLAAQYTALPVL